MNEQAVRKNEGKPEREGSAWWITAVIGLAALVMGLLVGGGAVRVMQAVGGPPGGGPPGAGGPPGGGGPPPASVVVGQALQMPLMQRFEVVGRIEPVKRATIAAEVDGKILELPVEPGDTVDSGETLLARVEDVWVKLALQQAEADVAAATAERDQSKRDLAYIETLAASQAAKPKELNDARATVEADEARLAAAIALRDRAIELTRRVEIRAPFDATVVAKRGEVGEWVKEGDPLFVLISRGPVDAVVNVPEQIVNRIALDATVDIIIDAQDRRITGRIISVNPDGDNAARTFPVEVRIDDPAVRVGMSVTAMLPLESQSDQLTVPRDAIQFGAMGPVVWVAAPPNPAGEQGNPEDKTEPAANEGPPPMPTALQVPVEIVFGHEDRFVVKPAAGPMAGLLHHEADVVVQGAEMIFFPGQPLAITQEAGPVASNEPTPTMEAEEN